MPLPSNQFYVENGALNVKTSPGGRTFRRNSDGTYEERGAVHGAIIHNACITPKQVAQCVWFNQRSNNPPALLKQLGWDDVLRDYMFLEEEEIQKLKPQEVLSQTEAINNGATPIKTRAQIIQELKQVIQKMEPLYTAGKHQDYWWWRKEIYSRIEQSPGFDPDDVSVRRMHFEALAAMAWLNDYPANKKRLDAFLHDSPLTMHSAYFETHFRQEGTTSDWPTEFAIITAFATTGEEWTADQNMAADRELEAELGKAGLWFRRLTGFSPTTGHAEPGWCVVMPVEPACDLGCYYKQDAIYFVRGDELFVTWCEPKLRGLVPVGRFRERIEAS